MGARPIALMDPLRFGPLDDARTRYLFDGVVAGHQRLRQRSRACPPWAARSCSTSATPRTRSSTCSASACCRSSGSCWPRPRALDNLAVLLGLVDGPGRHRRRQRARVGGLRGGLRGEAPVGAGRRPVRGEALHRGVPGAARRRPRGRGAGPRRGRHLGRDVGDGGEDRLGHGCRRRTRPAARAGHEPGRGDDVGEPGAHARDRHAGRPRRGARAVRALGDRGVGHRAGHRHRAVPCVRRSVRRDRGPGGEPRAAAATTADVRRARSRRCRRTALPSSTCPSAAWATARSTTGPLAAPAELAASRAQDPRDELGERFPAGSDLSEELLGAARRRRRSPTSRGCIRQYDHQLFLNTVVGPGGDATVLRLPGTDACARASRPTARPASARSTPTWVPSSR